MSTLINATLAAVVYLVYIGLKAEKRDTVTDTQITWFGFGDKQAVPAAQAAVLLRHRDVWVTEDEFNKGVAEGRYKAPVVPEYAPDDSDIDLGGIGDDLTEDTDPSDDQGDSGQETGLDDVGEASLEELQNVLISMDVETKPKVDAVRSAYTAQGGTKTVTTKGVNAAWASLEA